MLAACRAIHLFVVKRRQSLRNARPSSAPHMLHHFRRQGLGSGHLTSQAPSFSPYDCRSQRPLVSLLQVVLSCVVSGSARAARWPGVLRSMSAGHNRWPARKRAMEVSGQEGGLHNRTRGGSSTTPTAKSGGMGGGRASFQLAGRDDHQKEEDRSSPMSALPSSVAAAAGIRQPPNLW